MRTPIPIPHPLRLFLLLALLGAAQTFAAPPTISSIPDQSIPVNGITPFIPFTITDLETPATSLLLSASSTNTTLAPVNRITFSGSGSNRSVRVSPNPELAGFSLITLTVRDAAGETAASSFLLAVTNSPPTISDLLPRMLNPGLTSSLIPFVVFDKQTSPSNLLVTAASSHTNLIADQNIWLTGYGSNRYLRVRPELQLGTATLTLTVRDGPGDTATDTFDLILTNSRPTTTYPLTLLALINTPSPATNFAINDLETPPANLVVTAYSSNTTLIPDSQILLGGAGTNRSVSVVPQPNQVGSAPITLLVTDQFNAQATNQLTVHVSQFGEVPTGLPGCEYAALSWADFDNDGLLDFALMGYGASLTNTLYRNLGNGSFALFPTSFPGAYSGTLAWADFDSDGDLDLAFAGLGTGDLSLTRLYRNDSGTFVNLPTALPNLHYSALAWGDYDNDGDPDLLISGRSNNVAVTRLFRNDRATLTDSGIELLAVSSTVAAWGDYDSDGDLDLFLCGSVSGGSPSAQARIYRNAGNGQFVNLLAPISAYLGGSAAWGDYDNDGDLDVLIHGGNSYGGGYSAIFRNEGNHLFSEPSLGLDAGSRSGIAWGDYDNDGDLDVVLGYRYEFFGPHFYRNDNGLYLNSSNNILGIGQGTLAWGDYDNDGRLDLLQTGRRDYPTYHRLTRLFRNHGPVTNLPPTAPTQLTARVQGRAVYLHWAPSTDPNQPASLTYNLRVGTAPGTGNLLSPQSLPDGRRLLPAFGNAWLNTAWHLQNLSPGTYYASVQAVDAAFAGSPFSDPISFTIAAPPGPPAAITETVTGITLSDAILNGIANPNGLPATAWFEYGTTTKYSTKTPAVPIGNTTNDVSLSRKIFGLAPATPYHVRLAVANSAGTNFGLDRLFTTPAWSYFSELIDPLPESARGAGPWGDFDNDHDLDLVLGDRLYRNQGGLFVDSGNPIPYGVTWGDFNGDNRLDLFENTNVWRNTGLGTFTLQPLLLNLPPSSFYINRMAWADADNDGDLDVFVGRYSSGYGDSTLCRNDGNNTFTPIREGIPGGSPSAFGWLDYDNDGRLDILHTAVRLVAGSEAGLYRNLGDGAFATNPIVLTNGTASTIAWSDFDNDGDLDVVTGNTRFYLNQAGADFIPSPATNVPSATTLAWGDFDNDGDPDLLWVNLYTITGRVYRNDDGEFSDLGLLIEGARAASWADYDNDGDLDILVYGIRGGSQEFTRIYRNNSPVSNTPPTAPGNLSSSLAGKTTVLTWTRPTDPNQTNGWAYNLRVGSTPGGSQILSPMSSLTNGYRYLPQSGNAGVGTTWILTNLAVGTYYWSVQAVDHTFAGSPFAAERSFVVPPWPPDVLSAWSTNPTLTTVTLAGRVNPNNRSTTVWFQYGLTGNYTHNSATRLLPPSNTEITTNLLITGLSPLTTYHYRLVASNNLGVAYGPDQTFATLQFTEVPTTLNMPETWGGLWADLDTDGILDAFVQGIRNGTYGGYFHRNDGNGGFALPWSTPLPYVGLRISPTDLDRDGDIDLVIPGNYNPIFSNSGSGLFSNSTNSVGFESETILPADVDNDGDIDLFVTGYHGPSSKNMTVLFTNNGSGIVSDSRLSFTVSKTATAAWADTDSDGDLDLAFCGNAGNNSTNFSRLYRNDGVQGFQALEGVFAPVSGGAMTWCDYDGDGDMDMFLIGTGTNSFTARIYRRDAPNAFTEVNPGMVGLSSASAQWGDYDNDGRPDLLIAGYSNYAYYATLLYRNLGSDQFELQSTGMRGVFGGNAAWADYDRDGDLDILVAGRYGPAALYRNNALTPNSVPTPPVNLASVVLNGNSARLSWQPGTDANQLAGHTFSLRVGTAPGLGNVMSADAVSPGGARRVTGPGNVHTATNWLVRSLAPGAYYWSVQMVDHSHAGSAFAPEQTFTVLPFTQPPGLSMLEATNVEFFTAELRGFSNPNGVASVAWCEYGLTTNYGSTTSVQPIGNGSAWLNLSFWASNLAPATTYQWRLAASNANGVTYGFNQAFSTVPYTLFTERVQIRPFGDGSVAWGDYDNDGDLDILVTGSGYEGGVYQHCRVYRNDNGAFTYVPLGLPGTYHGEASWGDYDNDGDLDLVLCGNSDSYGNIARIYRNNGSASFTYIPAPLPAVYEGRTAWADFDRDGDLDLAIASSSGSGVFRNQGHDSFVLWTTLQTAQVPVLGVADIDNDGDLDILLTGYSNGSFAWLYLNDGSGAFTKVNAGVTAMSNGSMAWSDFDNDGDTDLALTGTYNTGSLVYGGSVYQNNGSGAFTDLMAGITGVQDGSAEWGDYDNDGYPDLLMTGNTTGYVALTKLFRNQGGTGVTDSGAPLQPTTGGTAVWGDYDNDGDLDFVQSGSGFTRVYRNNATNANVLPGPPSNLGEVTLGDSVLLTWSAPVDPNQPGGLTYNVRVGTAPGLADVLGPMSDPNTGFRRVAQPGNAGTLTWLRLNNLSSGTYYWSVQAIDHSLAGSAFAPEASFTLAPRAPDVLTTAATNVSITTATLTGYSTPNGAAATTWFEYGAGAYTNRTPPEFIGSGFVQVPVSSAVTNLFPGTIYHFRLVASNLYGTTFGADQTFLPAMFTEMPTPFAQVESGSAMWGDYDADGDLDLVLTGRTTNLVESIVSRIYRNEGNHTFTDINATLSPAWFPGNWGDHDNDGDLDLLLQTRLYQYHAGTFSLLSSSLPSLSFPATAWGDYDNDGRLDLLLAGYAGGSGSTSKVSHVYRNLGAGAFTNSVTTMQGVESPSVAWGDYDNDGDLDVLRTGFNTGGVRDSRVYRNNANGTFSSTAVFMLTGVTAGSGVWGDYDADGDLDLLLTGESNSGSVTKIYRNDGSDQFVEHPAALPGIVNGTALWVDYDNDGDLDIFLSGSSAGSLITRLYRNVANGFYVDSQIPFPGLIDSAAAWGDYDNDGDLDLLLLGYGEGSIPVTRLYRNNSRVVNVPPAAPIGLVSSVQGGGVRFLWQPASDPNQLAPLNYNLRVGRAPGAADVMSPMAIPSSGKRLVAHLGNAQLRTMSILTNLAPGTYYWSVQAIDHSFAASPFPPEATFVITNHPPLALSQTLVLAEDTAQPISLLASDLDNQPLTFQILAHPTNGTLTGTAPNLLYRPVTNYFGPDTFTFVAHDGLINSPPALVSLVVTQVWDVLETRMAIQPATGDALAVSITGEPYHDYSIETSDDLQNWLAVTNLSSAGGTMQIILTNTADFHRRFFRAVLSEPQ